MRPGDAEPPEELTRVYSDDDSRCLLLEAIGASEMDPRELADEPPVDDGEADAAWLYFGVSYSSRPSAVDRGPDDRDSTDPDLGRASLAPEPFSLRQRISTEPWAVSTTSHQELSRRSATVVGLVLLVAIVSWFFCGPLVKPLASRALGGGIGEYSASLATVGAPEPLVIVSVRVRPAEATVVLDGAPVPNPVHVRRRADSAQHTLVASAPGYAALTQPIRLDRDLLVVLELSPLSSESAVEDSGARAAANALDVGTFGDKK